MSLTLSEIQTIITNLQAAINAGASAIEYTIEGRTVKLDNLDSIRRNLDHFLRMEKNYNNAAAGLNTTNKVARFS